MDEPERPTAGHLDLWGDVQAFEHGFICGLSEEDANAAISLGVVDALRQSSDEFEAGLRVASGLWFRAG